MNAHKTYRRILFVCMGNICRSPAAENIFRKLVCDAGYEANFTIDSAGTIGYHTGNPMDSRMAETLRNRGYEVTGRARKINLVDLDRFDLVVTMDEENHSYVSDLVETREQTSKIRSLVEFCEAYEDPRVPDPYYGGQHGFEHVVNLLEDGCAGILRECLGGEVSPP